MSKEFFRKKDKPLDKATEEEATSLPLNEDGTVTVVGIRFRAASKIYYFHPGILTLREGDHAIVETSRGMELGEVKMGNTDLPAEKVTSPLKKVIRQATDADAEREKRNRELEWEAAKICKKKIAEHNLGMKLVSAEYTFDNAKLIFYFTCETRVDFRELVKDLASTFHTRIELRQIGIRDEAKMMGGLGVCGRKYCCSGFLNDFVQVSIKMAKEQNFSLNSAKISGACGRLMCCLSYEHPVYEEALKITPPVGTLVRTAEGEGYVIETKPLAAVVKVRLTDQNNDKELIKFFECKDLTILRLPQKKDDKKQQNAEEETVAED